MIADVVTVDLREDEFETTKELELLVKDLKQHLITEHKVILGAVVLSEKQQKQLRFDRYLHGVPIKQIRSQSLNKVLDVQVVITQYESGCLNCGSMAHWQ